MKVWSEAVMILIFRNHSAHTFTGDFYVSVISRWNKNCKWKRERENDRKKWWIITYTEFHDDSDGYLVLLNVRWDFVLLFGSSEERERWRTPFIWIRVEIGGGTLLPLRYSGHWATFYIRAMTNGCSFWTWMNCMDISINP